MQPPVATTVRLDGGVNLWVYVYYEGAAPTMLPGPEAVSVNGLAGRYSEEMHSGDGKVPDFWVASVIWEYAPNSWAEVSGHGDAAAPADLRDKILTVAEAVRPGGKAARLPFRVGDWPASLPSPRDHLWCFPAPPRRGSRGLFWRLEPVGQDGSSGLVLRGQQRR